MSNEYKEWMKEQKILTRKEHIAEDLYYEYLNHYRGEMQQFTKDVLSVVADMITDDSL